MAETIKVVRDGPRGWHLINKQDFDASKHVLFEDKEKEPMKSVEKRIAAQQTKDK